MKKITCTVMFIDISGSTQLYERLGNEAAKGHIESCLRQLGEIVVEHNGGGIRAIGDEIMCRFARVEDAIEAARTAQVQTSNAPESDGVRLSVRIGLHRGEVIVGDKDIFGDAANVAARMTAIAKAGQIITTSETIEHLSGELARQLRQIDLAPVKGKREKIAVYEFLWEQKELVTRASTDLLSRVKPKVGIVRLGFQQQNCTLDNEQDSVVVGRGDGCDLIVDTPLASRKHANVQLRRGKCIITDQSINGTYIETDNEQEVFLLREEFVLNGNGRISLGTAFEKCSETEVVSFECE